MTETDWRQTPLGHLDIAAQAIADPDLQDAGTVLTELGFRGQIILRGDSTASAFCSSVEEIVGFGPPVEPTTATGGTGFPRLLWLGPNEWLLVTEDALRTKTAERLAAALAGQHVKLLDVSDSRAVIGLRGLRARNVLLKGCPLDLHPRVFRARFSTRTVVGRVQIILHQIKETPEYEIYVHRSFAEYLWAWLEDAGLEYGVRIARA